MSQDKLDITNHTQDSQQVIPDNISISIHTFLINQDLNQTKIYVLFYPTTSPWFEKKMYFFLEKDLFSKKFYDTIHQAITDAFQDKNYLQYLTYYMNEKNFGWPSIIKDLPGMYLCQLSLKTLKAFNILDNKMPSRLQQSQLKNCVINNFEELLFIPKDRLQVKVESKYFKFQLNEICNTILKHYYSENPLSLEYIKLFQTAQKIKCEKITDKLKSKLNTENHSEKPELDTDVLYFKKTSKLSIKDSSQFMLHKSSESCSDSSDDEDSKNSNTSTQTQTYISISFKNKNS